MTSEPKTKHCNIKTRAEKHPVLIDILICTYKRPQLRACLESIAEQTLPTNYVLRFVIVDNCPEKSATAIVHQFSKSYKFDVEYLSCPVRNLSQVRNTALNAATGQYVALVDDDEVVSKSWLLSLIECSNIYDAEIVIGPVYIQYSESCPAWFEKSDLLARANPPSGKSLHTGHTCNALVRTSEFRNKPIIFDNNLGHLGGEDTDFFYRLYKRGSKIVACREAVAFEISSPDRENLEYLVQENKRVGQVFCYVFWPSFNVPQKIIALLTILTKLAIFGLIFLFTFMMGRRYSTYSRLRITCNFEKIRYLIKGDQAIRRYCC